MNWHGTQNTEVPNVRRHSWTEIHYFTYVEGVCAPENKNTEEENLTRLTNSIKLLINVRKETYEKYKLAEKYKGLKDKLK